MNMRNNETIMVGIILFTLYDKIPSIACFIMRVVPFDDKKKIFCFQCLLNSVPEISKFSIQKLSFHLMLIDLKRKRFEDRQ